MNMGETSVPLEVLSGAWDFKNNVCMNQSILCNGNTTTTWKPFFPNKLG
jgi:hypothetical protein